MPKRLLTSLFLALALLAPPLAAEEPLRIGLIFAQSGKAQISNAEHLKGAHFALRTLTEQHGKPPIELVEFDNRSSALGSKGAARQAIEQGMHAVVGPAWSSHSLAIAPLLQQARIPMVTPTATNPQVTLTGNYIFRACYNDTFQGRVMANFARQELQVQRVVLLINASEQFSITLGEIFTTAFEQQGGEVLWRGEYLGDALEFHDLLDQAASFKPELVVLPGYSKDSGFIIKQARDLGLTLPFIGPDGWSVKMYRYGGSAIDRNYFTRYWHHDLPTERSRDFVSRYQKVHAGTPSPAAAQTYDAVMLLVDAWERAGTSDPARLREALAATRGLAGVTGEITFNANGDPHKPVVVLQFRDGDADFVKSIEP